MNRLLLCIIYSLTSIICLAQSVKFKDVVVVNERVLFTKDIIPAQRFSDDALYKKLNDWAVSNYGKDPFMSSVRSDSKNNEIIAKSRIEFSLPTNRSSNEKIIMRYRINGMVRNGRYIFEITEISYMYENANEKRLPKVVRAEDFITNEAQRKQDDLSDIRINTRNRTLQYVNKISENLDIVFK